MLTRAESSGRLGLRSGEWVVVRSPEQILATLNEKGEFDRLLFQPEMFAFCGRRMRVFKSAHKTCDTIHKTGGRRMRDTVHLEAAYCDGSQHGGCQADCLMFWKEAWLMRESPAAGAPAAGARSSVPQTAPRCTEQTVRAAVHAPGSTDADPVWQCQTTTLFVASDPLKWWDLRQYAADIASGNHSAWHMLKMFGFAGFSKLVGIGVGYRALISLYDRWSRLRGGKPYPIRSGRVPAGQPTPAEALALQPGELVEVKSHDEILATLTEAGVNRGMRFDKEMTVFCGERYRVKQRVDRLINEQTGRMMDMKTPCIQLEGVFCQAHYSENRLGCPRALPSYWREIWLRRAGR